MVFPIATWSPEKKGSDVSGNCSMGRYTSKHCRFVCRSTAGVATFLQKLPLPLLISHVLNDFT